MRGEADAHDKAENGKKADLYMAPERKKMKMCFCPSVLRHSPLKVGCCCYGLMCGTLHLHFFFVTSARNSKRPSGREVGRPLTDIVCSLQRRRRAWQWGPVPLQTGALEGKKKVNFIINCCVMDVDS